MWRFLPVLLVGCYAPEVHEGAPCGAGGSCPAELRCSPATNTCEQTALAIDAPPVPIDTAMPDATPDSSCSGMMTFNYTGAIVMFSVPSCANSIRIEAWGAQGGNGTLATLVGGKGAHLAGTFASPPAKLKLLVGGKGLAAINNLEERGGTGGGGTFVTDMANAPLLVAGGGGGAVGDGFAAKNGGPGQITSAGQIGGMSEPGGINGNGGTTHSNVGYHAGTGAGGLLTDGTADSNGTNGTPNGRGKAFVNGGAGGTAGSAGRAGGFGGGGAAGFTGGGGGGYSGGASSDNDANADHAGGGGGSYNGGMVGTQIAESGIQTGDGKIIISW